MTEIQDNKLCESNTVKIYISLLKDLDICDCPIILFSYLVSWDFLCEESFTLTFLLHISKKIYSYFSWYLLTSPYKTTFIADNLGAAVNT